jgi:putative FmdB family regulatory protein
VPVYQYACTECDEELEVRQSFTDEALTVCPTCEGRLRKVLNAVGVVFKGSGFYRTDSRAAAAKGSPSDGSKGSPDKADSGKDAPSANGASKDSATKDAGANGSGSGAKQSGAKPAGDRKSGGGGFTSSTTGGGTRPAVGAR